MTQQAEIKTLNDGSIDYAHYTARAHSIRSEDAHRTLAIIGRMMRGRWTALKARFTPAPSQPVQDVPATRRRPARPSSAFRDMMRPTAKTVHPSAMQASR